MMERPQPDDGADPPGTDPGRDERPALPPHNPEVTPLDDEKHIEGGIEVNET